MKKTALLASALLLTCVVQAQPCSIEKDTVNQLSRKHNNCIRDTGGKPGAKGKACDPIKAKLTEANEAFTQCDLASKFEKMASAADQRNSETARARYKNDNQEEEK